MLGAVAWGGWGNAKTTIGDVAGTLPDSVAGLPEKYVRVIDNAGNVVIVGPNGEVYRDIAAAQLAAVTINRTDWPELSGSLREASNAASAALAGKGKINYGIGSFNSEQTMVMGEAWVGPGYRTTSSGYYESADGLRQFRPPSFKPQLGKMQANFEQRLPGQTKWGANGHVDVIP